MENVNSQGSIMTFLQEIDDRHPYLFSAVLAAILQIGLLFYTRSVDFIDDITPTDKLDIVDIDTIVAPKRIVKKSFSSAKGAEISTESNADRAQGTSELKGAVDIAFFPSIVPPKPIGKLKKIYPNSAKTKGIEATVFVELMIDITGKVRKVHIIGIRLTKDLPPESYAEISKDFSKAALSILYSARFTPSVVNGKKVPIKMELPLNFRLES